jgi:hypothetical protein
LWYDLPSHNQLTGTRRSFVYQLLNTMTGRAVPITTNTTTLVMTGPGKLWRIIIGEAAAGAITIYDALTATGTARAILKSAIPEGSYEFGMEFKTGLCIVTAASTKLTVIVG